MSDLIDTFAHRLSNAILIRNIKPAEISKKTGIDKSKLSSYMSGRYEAKQDGVFLLSKALNVNPSWLLGYDVPMEDKIEKNKSALVFVYGTIPAGIPMECIEDIIGTEEISVDMLKGGKQYFGLKIKGNSMYPDYHDGDIIILEKVEDCESGQDCVVMVNGNDGTFKKVIKDEKTKTIKLQPINTQLDANGIPLYEPITYTKEQIEQLPVRVIGKVVELRRKK